MPEIPCRWSNMQGEDEWHMEIEHDQFSTGEPFVVSVWMEGASEGIAWDGLATATPEQAREMAAALTLYADYADEANGRVANRDSQVDRTEDR
jgi:hypothetical protein